MATPRQNVKPDTRRPIDTQAKGLRATEPKIIKGRDDPRQVKAFETNIKGGKTKARKRWPYQD